MAREAFMSTMAPRKKDQNIIRRLRLREIVDFKPGISHYFIHRKLYQNVFPNMSVMNIDTPSCFLRKFTPDGRYLIAFSNDQYALIIYEYRGPSAANELLTSLGVNGDCAGNRDDENPKQARLIRSKIFQLFFKLKNVIHLTNNNEQLNRECSLFTEDSRYVIVASAALANEGAHPIYDEVRNNESINLNYRRVLEDYCLHLIDIRSGKQCDSLSYKIDRIMLSHNQGIYLHKDVLAVLSIQHQTIHIYNIVDDPVSGKRFVKRNSIGRFCFEDDEALLSYAIYDPHQPQNRPCNELWINSLKQRLLAHLFRDSKQKTESTGDPRHLAKFYQNFDHYLSLKMWKMQLLDEDHLFIKYAAEEVFTGRTSESLPSFFAVYQISTATIHTVYENTSSKLLWLFENFCDFFRNCHFKSYQHISSPSNNIYARLLHQRCKDVIANARYGGQLEATRRTLSILPISAQSYSPSPYLDLSLFSYDDKWVSAMERPKACGEHPIKFYARDSGYLRFKVHAEMETQNPPHHALRLVVFAFHPFDPFALSFQRTNSEYIVNLHLRHVNQS
ncbi:de-etiolated protein 1 abo [Brevipalpus obovatus]|uniref:de-etiolated protein 1 abo n=1 Tax=Brevipalpus obovatus TaxID=246614 RepID=UPI003D9F4CBF